MDRGRLLERLDQAWQDLRRSHAGLTESQLVEPGVTGEWSVRDGGIEAFNALMTERKKDLSVAEVLAQMDAAHRRIIDMVRDTGECEIVRETRFRRRLRLDTYHHCPVHAEAIRAWRSCR